VVGNSENSRNYNARCACGTGTGQGLVGEDMALCGTGTGQGLVGEDMALCGTGTGQGLVGEASRTGATDARTAAARAIRRDCFMGDILFLAQDCAVLA